MNNKIFFLLVASCLIVALAVPASSEEESEESTSSASTERTNSTGQTDEESSEEDSSTSSSSSESSSSESETGMGKPCSKDKDCNNDYKQKCIDKKCGCIAKIRNNTCYAALADACVDESDCWVVKGKVTCSGEKCKCKKNHKEIDSLRCVSDSTSAANSFSLSLGATITVLAVAKLIS